MFTACVEFVSGWQHARNYIGRTRLGWIDGQKSPVFRRGKSGNPTYGTQLVGLYILLYMVAQNKIPHLKICNISATMQWSDFKNS